MDVMYYYYVKYCYKRKYRVIINFRTVYNISFIFIHISFFSICNLTCIPFAMFLLIYSPPKPCTLFRDLSLCEEGKGAETTCGIRLHFQKQSLGGTLCL